MSTNFSPPRANAGAKVWKIVVAVFIIAVAVFELFPLIVVIDSSTTSTGIVTFPGNGFSLKWFQAAFENKAFVNGLVASLILSALTAVIGTIIGAIVGRALALRRGTAASGNLLYFLTLPLLLPAVVMGLGSLQFWSVLHVGLGLGVLLIGHLVVTLPYSIRTMTIAFGQVDPNLEGAAQVLGAKRSQILRQVMLPMVVGGLVSSFALTFLVSFDEVALSLFLSSPNFTPLPVVMFTYLDQSVSPAICAISTVVVGGSLVLVAIIQRTVGLGRVFGLDEADSRTRESHRKRRVALDG